MYTLLAVRGEAQVAAGGVRAAGDQRAMNSSPNGRFRDLASKSGFGFQLAAEEALRSARINWRIVAREVPWESGFIDLVLRGHSAYAVVEFKRVANGDWLFLAPEPADQTLAARVEAFRRSESQAAAEVVRIRQEMRRVRPDDPTFARGLHHLVKPYDVDVVPESFEAEFCVTSETDEKGKARRGSHTLEQIARELVDAAFDLAGVEELERISNWELFIPVIVTTARLRCGRLPPGSIDLASGSIREGDFEEVPYARFRKSLVNRGSDTTMTLEDWKADRERTVFVVHAGSMVEFFSQLGRVSRV